MIKGSKQAPTHKGNAFHKLFNDDEIFHTEMLGEVRVSRLRDNSNRVRVDAKLDGQLYTSFIDNGTSVIATIKGLDEIFTMMAE